MRIVYKCRVAKIMPSVEMLPELFQFSSLELLFLGQTFISWAEAAFFTDLFDLRSIDLELLSLFRGVPFRSPRLVFTRRFSPKLPKSAETWCLEGKVWLQQIEANKVDSTPSLFRKITFISWNHLLCSKFVWSSSSLANVQHSCRSYSAITAYNDNVRRRQYFVIVRL